MVITPTHACTAECTHGAECTHSLPHCTARQFRFNLPSFLCACSSKFADGTTRPAPFPRRCPMYRRRTSVSPRVCRRWTRISSDTAPVCCRVHRHWTSPCCLRVTAEHDGTCVQLNFVVFVSAALFVVCSSMCRGL